MILLQVEERIMSHIDQATINPFHPNISIHIFHTFLYTFPLVLTSRIFFTIKASDVSDYFLYSHDLNE